MSSLVLGTAQLGMDYGVANSKGKPSQKNATEIVAVAWENGINEFDTAQGYGSSEHSLGRALRELGITSAAKVSTKLLPNLDYSDFLALSSAVELSLKNLGLKKLHGLMLHDEALLARWNQKFGSNLRKFVESGLADFIGISVYSPEKAIQAINTDGIDFVQIPTNILDRRFEDSQIYELAQQRKKSIYIRSAFLQGLILISTQHIPEHLAAIKPVLEDLDELCAFYKISRHDIAIGYLKRRFPEAKIIFGAETVLQVMGNIKSWHAKIPNKLFVKIAQKFEGISENLLNPSCWTQLKQLLQ